MTNWERKGGFDIYGPKEGNKGSVWGWVIGIAFVLILLAAA